jgi:8-oxo-dGTP pyrophosphatase MutT (NUDIX family)
MMSDGAPPVPGDGPVPLRPAATLMLVRGGPDAGSALEVLMVRRNLQADFVGGAYVFPGGAVDPADGAPEAATCSRGLDDETASRILDLPAGGLAYWVAAVRECFEEAGILLAYRDPDHASAGGTGSDSGTGPDAGGGSRPVAGGNLPLLSLATRAVAERVARHRRAVNDGRRRFLDVCREDRVQLALDRIHYFSHWVTPEGAPRRYDTRFFVAAAPADQVPVHDAGETVASVWIRPADALRRFRDGDIELIFPTIRTLQAIGRFATCQELVAAASAAGQVPVTLPRVVVDGRGVRIMLPGDPGYEEAVGSAAGSGRLLDYDLVVRTASRAAAEEPPAG